LVPTDVEGPNDDVEGHNVLCCFSVKAPIVYIKKHLIRKHHAVQLFHENVQIRNEDDPPLNDISEEGTSAIELVPALVHVHTHTHTHPQGWAVSTICVDN
jgi:hypothetical protein